MAYAKNYAMCITAVLALLMLCSCGAPAAQPTPEKLAFTPTPALTATDAPTPRSTVAPSPSVATSSPEAESAAAPEQDTEETLRRFLSPMVQARDRFPVGEKPDDEAMLAMLHNIVYDAVARDLFGDDTFPGRIETTRVEDDFRIHIAPGQFVKAAKDYLQWDVTPEVITAYYETWAMDSVADSGDIILYIGEGDMHQIPYIATCSREGDCYRVTMCNAIADQPFLMPHRTAEAMLRVNPDSMFGYTLVSYTEELMLKDVSASDTRAKHPVKNVFDGQPETTWVPSSPTNSWVQMDFSRAVKLRGVLVLPGNARSEEVMRKSNRVKTLQAEFSDGTSHTWHLKDMQLKSDYWWGEAILSLPEPVLTEFLTLTVLEVYPGSANDDTSIGELAVLPAD